MDILDSLERLGLLRDNGTISQSEFEAAKLRLLTESAPATSTFSFERMAGLENMNVRTWAMFIHFSLLAGLLLPVAGFILPIILWQVKKDEYPDLDQHGKMVVNWMISLLIYVTISSFLSFFLIGIPLLVVLSIMGIVFPIIGGIKANNGIFWKYPVTITFLK